MASKKSKQRRRKVIAFLGGVGTGVLASKLLGKEIVAEQQAQSGDDPTGKIKVPFAKKQPAMEKQTVFLIVGALALVTILVFVRRK